MDCAWAPFERLDGEIAWGQLEKHYLGFLTCGMAPPKCKHTIESSRTFHTGI